MGSPLDPLNDGGAFAPVSKHAEIFGQSAGQTERVLDVRKLDFLKLNYRQEIDRLTKEMIDQA